MNGRVYDPKLGRMLSPDPVTQAPENGQNYNRYSYVSNNPLKYTDPNGFQKKDIKCADGCYTGAAVGVGLAMEHVRVTGSRSSSGIVGNPAALLGGGGGSSSPIGMAGDKADGGSPAKEDEPVGGNACNDPGNECTVQQNGTQTIITLLPEGSSNQVWVTFPWFIASNFNTGQVFYSSPRTSGAAATQAIQGGAMMLGAGVVTGICTAFPSACSAAAQHGLKALVAGSIIRGGTGQAVNPSTLVVDATLGAIVGPPFAALSAASGPIGQWIWQFNSHTATIPMNLPPKLMLE